MWDIARQLLKKNVGLSVLICLVFCLALFGVGFNAMAIKKTTAARATEPDIVVYGATYTAPEGEYPFIAYEDIGDSTADLEGATEDGTVAHRLVIRSLFNYFDTATGYGFEGNVYGMPEALMLELLGERIRAGVLPRPGEKEALVGEYFAKHIGLDVGDPIPQTITLANDWDDSDIDAYTVSGIVDESVSDLFVGSAMIALESYEQREGPVSENALAVNLSDSGENKVFEGVPNARFYRRDASFNILTRVIRMVLAFAVGLALAIWLATRMLNSYRPKLLDWQQSGLKNKVLTGGVTYAILLLLLIAFVAGLLLTWLTAASLNAYISDFYEFKASEMTFGGGTALAVLGAALIFALLFALMVPRLVKERLAIAP